MSRIFACFALLIFMSACAADQRSAAAGDIERRSIEVANHEREYLLYRPANENSGKRPLVLVFHGGGGTARGIAREVGASLHAIADREGFFVVYPDAIDRTWDFGAGVVSEALDVRVDDEAFFGALIEALTNTLPIDERRVFATGISRGGQASYFVACKLPGRIRAIAPVAMPMPVFMHESCSDAPATGVAILNGTDDPLVPYNGGQIKVFRRERGEVMSTDATVEFWNARNGCSAQPTATQMLDNAPDAQQVRRVDYQDCSGEPVRLYRIEGGGHTWPSGRQYLPRSVVGPVNRDIDAAAEIWSFFASFL